MTAKQRRNREVEQNRTKMGTRIISTTPYAKVFTSYLSKLTFYRTFECRIFLDVDCTEAEKMDSPTEIMRFLEGTEKLEKHGNSFDPNLTTQVFCNLIDR